MYSLLSFSAPRTVRKSFFEVNDLAFPDFFAWTSNLGKMVAPFVKHFNDFSRKSFEILIPGI